MEKRLVLAFILSFAVLVAHQMIFGSKDAQQVDNVLQNIAAEQVARQKTDSDTNEGSLGLNSSVEMPEAAESMNVEEIVLQNDNISLKTSNQGVRIEDVSLKQYNYGFPVKNWFNLGGYNKKSFKILSQTAQSVEMSNLSDGIELIREISILDQYEAKMTFKYRNNSNSTRTVYPKFSPITLDFTDLPKNTEDARDHTLYEYAVSSEGKIKRKGNAVKFSDKNAKTVDRSVDWAGFRDRYFAGIIKPEFETEGYKVDPISKEVLNVNLLTEELVLVPGQEKSFEFFLYFGPQDLKVMSQYGQDFEDIISFNSFSLINYISKLIHAILRYIHMVVPNWGLCIILISFIIYGVSYPLTAKGLRSMKKMQALQPKMTELKEKYKDDAKKMNEEVMKLYQTSGVNPIGGCLPMLLQMPIFFGLYQVLWRSIYFRGADFLWITDLSKPDHLFKLPVTVPFIGEYFNILPILMIVIMMVQQKMNARNTVAATPEQAMQQKMMSTFFPVVMGFVFYNFASGLSLYFTVFYMLSTFTQWKISTEKV